VTDPAELDPEAVRAAAARWIWIPVDATEVETEDYRLTHYTDYSSVQWSRTERPVVEVMGEVLDHARVAGRPTLRWWVDERTVPRTTEATLLAFGLTKVERLEVLALPVATDLEVPEDVTVPCFKMEAARSAIFEKTSFSPLVLAFCSIVHIY
jgi:hypothetical protein